MAQANALVGITKDDGLILSTIISGGAGDSETKAVVTSECGLEKGATTCSFLVGDDIGRVDAGGNIDTGVNIFPTDNSAIKLTRAVPVDAVVYTVEPNQFPFKNFFINLIVVRQGSLENRKHAAEFHDFPPTQWSVRFKLRAARQLR